MTYTCVICKKDFRDKTKWNNHKNRKYPCKYKAGDVSSRSKCRLCILCKEGINGTYEKHLRDDCVSCHYDIVKYGFKSKTFAKNLYKNDMNDYSDLYILSKKGTNNGVNMFYFIKNLYKMKDKMKNYENYEFCYYMPIKNVKDFLDMVVEEGLKFNCDIEIDLDELKNKLKAILYIVNGDETVVNEPKTKIKQFYKCPKCEEFKLTFDSANELMEHLKVYHNEIMENGTDILEQIDNKKLRNDLLKLIGDDGSKCNICGKNFTTKGNMLRHRVNCKDKNSYNDNMDYLIEKNTKLEHEVRTIKNLLKKEKSKNIINNTTNIMQNNIQININDFGKEDISHISMEFVKDLIVKMNSYSIVKYIEKVHFSNPMNMNILIPNSKDKFILLKNGDTWTMNDKNLVLNGMIVKNFDRINDAYEQMSGLLPGNIRKIYNDYADQFDTKKLPNERMIVKNKTEEMIINKQKEVISGQLEDVSHSNHSYQLE